MPSRPSGEHISETFSQATLAALPSSEAYRVTAKTYVSTSNVPYTLSIEADGVTSPVERVVRCHRVRRQRSFRMRLPERA